MESSVDRSTSKDGEIQNTFKLLAEGDKQIVLDNERKKFTLVIGNTGSGKSTLLQWLFGDNDNLISVESGPSEFIIEDGNRIGSSINSKTTFPELVVDNRTNAAYYDCPGFSDTRSTSYNIANTYFIKKLTDHVDYVKILLTVDHSSVRKGKNRSDFLQLLRHTTEMVKNIEKFRNSIAIVVTKVENHIVRVGKNYHAVSDDEMIRGIANFLEVTKEDVATRLSASNVTSDETKFLQSALQLIEIFLLRKGDGRFGRITIFRRPDEAGPLSRISLLQDAKLRVLDVLDNELKFIKTDDHEFGHTISDRSKNEINALVDEINRIVWHKVSKVVEKMHNYYKTLIESMLAKITSNGNNANEAYDFSAKLRRGQEEVSKLVENTNSSIEELVKQLRQLSCVDAFNESIQEISLQGQYMKFLQVVSDKELSTRPWAKLFERLSAYLENAEANVDKESVNAAEKVREGISQATKEIAEDIESQYRSKMETMEVEKLPNKMYEEYKAVFEMIWKLKSVQNVEGLTNVISNGAPKLDIDSAKIMRSVSNIESYGRQLKFLKILNDDVVIWSPKWTESFDKTLKFLEDGGNWYTFLQSLYEKLSTYEIQKDPGRYNVANVADWGKEGKTKGIQIRQNNFKQFMDKVSTVQTKLFMVEEVNQLQLLDLNHVLELTLKNGVHIECDLDQMVVKGGFVKFTDFLHVDGKLDRNLCEHSVKSVNIFALHTIFIDRDFDAVGDGLNVGIVAPKWQVEGSRTIRLDGEGGTAFKKAKTGSTRGGRGVDGLAGMPGGNAGNFFGIGYQFSNIGHLTISANGGHGGPGQDGGDGGPGLGGEDAHIDGWKSPRWQNFDSKFLGDTEHRVFIAINRIYKKYIFYGRNGQRGGRGGNGGVGGLGGNEGEIKVNRLDKSLDLPVTSNAKGSNGRPGKGGSGGRGGKKGNNWLAIYEKASDFYTIFIPYGAGYKEQWVEIDNTRAPDGEPGTDNLNSIERHSPKEATPQNVTNILTSVKSYLQENLSDRFKKFSLMKFLSHLESVSFNHTRPPMIETYNKTEETLNPRIESENGLHVMSNLIDLNGTLALGQLMTGMIFGNNKTLKGESYMSPNEVRNAQVDLIEDKVSEALELGDELYGTEDED